MDRITGMLPRPRVRREFDQVLRLGTSSGIFVWRLPVVPKTWVVPDFDKLDMVDGR